MSAIAGTPPTAADLAWHADRLTLADLDDATRLLLERAADYLAGLWPDDDGLDDHDPRLAEAEARIELIGATLKVACGLDVVTDDDLKNRLEQALEAARDEGHKDALVPSRKTAASKARRLLIEGRMIVKRIDHDGDHAGLIVATCRGDSGAIYDLGYDPRGKGQWRCTCEELRGSCSHLAALKLITAVRTEG